MTVIRTGTATATAMDDGIATRTGTATIGGILVAQGEVEEAVVITGSLTIGGMGIVVRSVLAAARVHVLDVGRHRPADVLVVLARALVRVPALVHDLAAAIASLPKPLHAPLVAR
jgi:hypothetical protein